MSGKLLNFFVRDGVGRTDGVQFEWSVYMLVERGQDLRAY